MICCEDCYWYSDDEKGDCVIKGRTAGEPCGDFESMQFEDYQEP